MNIFCKCTIFSIIISSDVSNLCLVLDKFTHIKCELICIDGFFYSWRNGRRRRGTSRDHQNDLATASKKNDGFTCPKKWRAKQIQSNCWQNLWGPFDIRIMEKYAIREEKKSAWSKIFIPHKLNFQLRIMSTCLHFAFISCHFFYFFFACISHCWNNSNGIERHHI